MSLESADFIPGLVATNPEGTDPKSQGDDHLRLLKHVLKSQFPAFLGVPVTKTEAQLNAALNAGDFGLGGVVVVLPEFSINDPDIASGFYWVEAAGAGLLPINDSFWMLAFDLATAGHAARVLVRVSNGEAWFQSKTGGVWQPYRRAWDQLSLVKQGGQGDHDATKVAMVGGFGLGKYFDIRTSLYVTGLPSSLFGIGTVHGFADGGPGGLAIPGVAAFTYGTLTVHSQYTDQTGGGATSRQFTIGNASWTQTAVNASTWGPWLKHAIITAESLGANGYRVTSGFVEQWGQTGPINDETAASIVFPIAMTECFSVVVSPIATATGTVFVCGGVSNFSGSGFTLQNMTNFAGPFAYKWFATGRV